MFTILFLSALTFASHPSHIHISLNSLRKYKGNATTRASTVDRILVN